MLSVRRMFAVWCISIHAPRKGERRCTISRQRLTRLFQSTLPARGSDVRDWAVKEYGLNDFNPRSPQGGATSSRASAVPAIPFQSTLPARGSDSKADADVLGQRDFNPRSPQGGATSAEGAFLHWGKISIHAPRKGERPFFSGPPKRFFQISIHAPRKGERQNVSVARMVLPLFQSTLPARGSDGLIR